MPKGQRSLETVRLASFADKAAGAHPSHKRTGSPDYSSRKAFAIWSLSGLTKVECMGALAGLDEHLHRHAWGQLAYAARIRLTRRASQALSSDVLRSKSAAPRAHNATSS